MYWDSDSLSIRSTQDTTLKPPPHQPRASALGAYCRRPRHLRATEASEALVQKNANDAHAAHWLLVPDEWKKVSRSAPKRKQKQNESPTKYRGVYKATSVCAVSREGHETVLPTTQTRWYSFQQDAHRPLRHEEGVYVNSLPPSLVAQHDSPPAGAENGTHQLC